MRVRVAEAEEMLPPIQGGELGALVVEAGAGGRQVDTLQGAAEPFRSLVEEMHEGAVVLTSRGDILYANARFSALVGKPLASVVGSRMARFVNTSDSSDFAALLDAGSGRSRSRLISPSGTFEVSLSLTTVLSTSGCHLNLIVTDLTDLLAANNSRDRAEHDNRAKDQFMAMVAHELRNPLAAISNAVQVLELSHREGAQATAAHQVIARQVGHLSRLAGDLLDVERVVSGKIRLNRQPLNMAEAVRRAVATITSDGRLNRTIDVRTEPAWVDGDPVRLEQVLINIVTNAVKYTPAGGRIRLDLRADGDDVVLTVDDNGFGISPELMPFLFGLYMQSERTLDCARGGMGIGLALVLRLVELHGGTIVASSDGEGRGSTFTVRLRRVPSPGDVFQQPSL